MRCSICPRRLFYRKWFILKLTLSLVALETILYMQSSRIEHISQREQTNDQSRLRHESNVNDDITRVQLSPRKTFNTTASDKEHSNTTSGIHHKHEKVQDTLSNITRHQRAGNQSAGNQGAVHQGAGHHDVGVDTVRDKGVDPKGPGERGAAVRIDVNTLSLEERKQYDAGYRDYAFNQYASDMISLHRSLPDVRNSACRTISYPDNLPSTSVIIIFYNEAWSALLRTVHSVLDRSPPHLLEEILLVDDFSDYDHLHQELQSYVDMLDKVKLVRSERRQGLINARLLGTSVAKGEILTFLDSHCEATEGWLEPLLGRIAQSESNVVFPMIDTISLDTFAFFNFWENRVGGFSWDLTFTWYTPKKRQAGLQTDPKRSPTMPGGLFSISRAYFETLGKYDPQMAIWGGENLELSFKTWMCGGAIEEIPCSHVGHVFRSRNPYTRSVSDYEQIAKNLARLSAVWLDEYNAFYLDARTNTIDYGDVSDRMKLRSSLNCQNFEWYLRNVYVDAFDPKRSIATGQIKNAFTNLCIDSGQISIAFNCHKQKGAQFWRLSEAGEIRTSNGKCVTSAKKGIQLLACNESASQLWDYTLDNQIRLKNKTTCLQLSGQNLELADCENTQQQIWSWNRGNLESQYLRKKIQNIS